MKDVKPSNISKRITKPKATLETLLAEVKQELQRHERLTAKGQVPEPVFIIFAVGLYDLVPDSMPVSLIKNLNGMVAKMRTVKEELKFYFKSVCNICFALTYPPSMFKIGAGDFVRHAQQFVDIVFRWYNRWVTDLNGYLGTGRCRLDKPYHCVSGRYKLKQGQIAEDGINPTEATAKAFERSINKYVDIVKERIRTKEGFTVEERGHNLLAQSWACIKKAESVYLNAISGRNTTFEHVFMPFVSSFTQKEKVPANEETGATNTPAAEPASNSTAIVEETTSFAGAVKAEPTAASAADPQGEAPMDLDDEEQDEEEEEKSKTNQQENSKLRQREGNNSEPRQQNEGESISRQAEGDNSKLRRRRPNTSVVYQAHDKVLNDENVEKELHVYHVAKKYVELSSPDITHQALALLEKFKASEKTVLENREAEDRERIADFQRRMKDIVKNFQNREGRITTKIRSVPVDAVFQTGGYTKYVSAGQHAVHSTANTSAGSYSSAAYYNNRPRQSSSNTQTQPATNLSYGLQKSPAPNAFNSSERRPTQSSSYGHAHYNDMSNAGFEDAQAYQPPQYVVASEVPPSSFAAGTTYAQASSSNESTSALSAGNYAVNMGTVYAAVDPNAVYEQYYKSLQQ